MSSTIFTVSLQFHKYPSTHWLDDDISFFLGELPTYLQKLCVRDITFAIRGIELNWSHRVDITLELSSTPPPESKWIHPNDVRGLGIRDPEHTRRHMELILWLQSLYRIGIGPVQAAWLEHSRIHSLRQSDCPVQFIRYNISAPKGENGRQSIHEK
jgi:hypothetical protein